METPGDIPLEEAARLRHCLNDLVSVMALSALWTDKEPRQIAEILADALFGMLGLAFVLVRLNDPEGGAPLEIQRTAQTWKESHEIRRVLDGFQRGDAAWHVAYARFGVRGEMGSVAAGSERPDFPNQEEKLLLDVAANQAFIGLQHAFALSEQRRVASKLEEHVTQGTRELAIANEELRKRERNLRLIIDTIPAFVWRMLPDGSNEFISEAWHAHTGVPPEESRGWGWMSVFHPDDLPALMKKWAEVMGAGVPDETEARIRRHDGTYRWFLIRASPFRDEAGNIIRWYGTSTDIEDRKRAEQALESRGHDLKLIIDTIPTLSWSTDATGFVEFLSRPWLDFTGLSAEEALGFGWAVAVHPGDAQRLLEYWQAALASGTRVDVEVDWSPILRQMVKTHFSANGELSHGLVTQAVHAGV